LGVVEVALDAPGELGAGDPAPAAEGAEVLGEEDGGDGGLAGAGGPPEGDPAGGAGPATQSFGPRSMEVGRPGFAGEAAEELGNSGAVFGEGLGGFPGVVAGGAEAVFRDAAESDHVFAALAAVPGDHEASVVSMISWACCQRSSSAPAAQR